MTAALRSELAALLQDVPTTRLPTIKRCQSDNALLSTNLPFLAPEEEVNRFISACEARGWTVQQSNGWLLLDHPILPPDAPVPKRFSGEIGCLISLLLRHPDDAAPCTKEMRTLAKKCEESAAATAQYCAVLHREWAQKLRDKVPLPGQLLPFLCYIYRLFEEEMP